MEDTKERRPRPRPSTPSKAKSRPSTPSEAKSRPSTRRQQRAEAKQKAEQERERRAAQQNALERYKQETGVEPGNMAARAREARRRCNERLQTAMAREADMRRRVEKLQVDRRCWT